jgi:hypothetical protein
MDVEKVMAVKVTSINDLARMAATIVSMGQSTYVLRYVDGGKTVYGLLAVFRDYYKFYGLPMFYYYVEEGEDRTYKYLLLRSDETGENVILAKGPKPGWIMVPIIDVVEAPGFLPPLAR